jgi:hypothetical protein
MPFGTPAATTGEITAVVRRPTAVDSTDGTAGTGTGASTGAGAGAGAGTESGGGDNRYASRCNFRNERTESDTHDDRNHNTSNSSRILCT